MKKISHKTRRLKLKIFLGIMIAIFFASAVYFGTRYWDGMHGGTYLIGPWTNLMLLTAAVGLLATTVTACMEQAQGGKELNDNLAEGGRDEKMREILFRGKRIDNGEWVHGNLMMPSDWDLLNGDDIIIIECRRDGHCYTVDHTTIGQYTGLTSKNGVKIFEGDIIQGKGGDCFRIRWSAAKCGFTAGEGKHMWPSLNQITVMNYEVVGNIHDNPELLIDRHAD